MFDIFPSKESIRFLLRRHIIGAHKERKQIRCLHDCLDDPTPRHPKKTWWPILFIPTFYTLYVLGLKTQQASDISTVVNLNESLEVNHQLKIPGPTHLGKQLMPPVTTTTTEENIERFWFEFWTLRDAELHKIPMTTTEKNTQQGWLPVCKLNLNSTGNVTLNLLEYNGSLENIYPMVKNGGFYKPSDCWSRNKVAILVPYRDRPQILKTFLINLHPFLMAQKLEYRIFVVEQHGTGKFNKGKLLNAGFKVVQKFGAWGCVVLHDVDLLPLNPHIMYSCPTFPRLMSSTVVFLNGSCMNMNQSHPRFGGVTAMSPEHYERVNGHSNLYRGWGHEDHDMYLRLFTAGIKITTNKKSVSRYVHLPHSTEHNNEMNWSLLVSAPNRYKHEGLSTLDCRVLNITYHHLFTHILVSWDEKPKQLFKKIKYSYKPPVYENTLLPELKITTRQPLLSLRAYFKWGHEDKRGS